MLKHMQRHLLTKIQTMLVKRSTIAICRFFDASLSHAVQEIALYVLVIGDDRVPFVKTLLIHIYIANFVIYVAGMS